MADLPTSVALVIQTRVADEAKGTYASWQVRVGEQLASQPGFLGQEVRTPTPPLQVDWFIIQHFSDTASARRWMESAQLSALLKEVEPLFVGDTNISIVDDSKTNYGNATVSVTCRVAPEHETAFMDWERQIFRAEAAFPGFVGHRLERPIPGLQPRWTMILTFASERELSAWLDSPQRAALIEKGKAFQEDVHLSKAGYGFDFWSNVGEKKETPESIFKGNLIVLMVLYPVVFLWGYFVGNPFLGGIPFWIALFIGNLFSTQVLGWYIAPKAFKSLGWWLAPNLPANKQFKGYAIVISAYIVSLAVYALLMKLKLMG